MSFEWSAKITKVENGYVLDFKGVEDYQTIVVEENNSIDERLAELQAFKDVQGHLREHFAIFNSKHEKYNLRTTIEGVDEE